MTEFDPAAVIAAIEAAGASMCLLIHEDGSRGWSVSRGAGPVRWSEMPMLGGFTDEQIDAVLEELWHQGKAAYAGAALRSKSVD